MIRRGEGGDGRLGGPLWSPASASRASPITPSGNRRRDGGPHSPPDCVHKGPPRSSQPPSPLEMLMGFS